MPSVPPGPFLVDRADVVVAGEWWAGRRRAWIALGVCGAAEPATEAAARPAGAVNGCASHYAAPEITAPLAARPAAPLHDVREALARREQPDGLLATIAPASPYEDPFLAHHAARLAGVGDGVLDLGGWDRKARGAVGFDVESYPNFFVACFKRFADGSRVAFERSDRAEIDADALESVLRDNVIVSFNGRAYDMPMVYLALAGAGPARLKEASDRIISGRMKPWEVRREFGIGVPELNHIDLMEPNPSVRQGLKVLQGRLHCRFMVDLPYPPEAHLTPAQRNVATLYCFNDIDGTEALYEALREPLRMRSELGRIYGLELRSKSDSQVGEAIVRRRVEIASGNRVAKNVEAAASFGYSPPAFLEFDGSRLADLLAKLGGARFDVGGGKITGPEFLGDPVTIGGADYSVGIGGLHSTEAHRALRSDDANFLLDVDVASQYPNIILRLGMYPRSIGPTFLQIYGDLIGDRLAAKAAGDRVRADGGKIALNGVFGKLGSPHSCLYSPDLLIAVTLTGQLAILMLIERAERARIPVVSANTDGVVFHCPRAREAELDGIVAGWEAVTGFTVERTRYAALYSSSVNTYIAVREDGGVKRKGAIANPWGEGDLRGQMSKNPQMTVCSDALVRHVVDGVPVEETIDSCRDPRAFVTVIKVTGGATWRGHPLGRAVRYYWSTDGDAVHYADGSRRVAKTEGARPLQELRELPADVDLPRYHLEARRLADDMKITL